MKVYYMENYRIRHNCGRSEPTGSFYIARNGKKKEVMKYVITYETAVGEFLPEDWESIVKRCVEESGATELLEKIIDHCRTHCVWLKSDKEREEYALDILIGRSYRAWKISRSAAQRRGQRLFSNSQRRKCTMVLCGKCGRTLKDPESIRRGFGPVCYGKIMPPAPKKDKTVRKSNDNYNFMEDPDYQIPGQMELSDFIEM